MQRMGEPDHVEMLACITQCAYKLRIHCTSSRHSDRCHKAIGACVIPTLVGLLRCGIEVAAANAAFALAELAYSSDEQNPVTEQRDAICAAGAIPPLVKMIAARPLIESARASEYATCALNNLSTGTTDSARTHCNAIHKAGAVPPLVALLAAGVDSKACQYAIRVLSNIAYHNTAIRNTMRKAGAIPPLVKMLAAGAQSETAENTARALGNLSCNDRTNTNAIHKAGAVPPLVALLSAELGSNVLKAADMTLGNLAADKTATDTAVTIILTAVVAAAPPLAKIPNLTRHLRPVVHAQLLRAEAGERANALRSAIDAAAYFEIDASRRTRARARLVNMDVEAERQARRESLGVTHVPTPHEFVCPITYVAMVDPVVASDGHSYEREAIEEVFNGGNGRSPLTREILTVGVLIPNHNLRKRIREYDGEVLHIADSARAALLVKQADASKRKKRVKRDAVDTSA
jgi:hypothetical protein